MSSVTWLCVVGLVLSAVALLTSYVAVGVFGVVLFPLFAWFDWHEFGTRPPDASPTWWRRFGPPEGGSGGSKVPARPHGGPRQPSGAKALPLPED